MIFTAALIKDGMCFICPRQFIQKWIRFRAQPVRRSLD